ncbi:MAG: ferredoxin [Candidatus Riflebacteria bacterium HGW-Riflebacteria-1]|jgi:ferredoxin|nr:MAG: ferredoxin [Candidatus Riflebacteria bacterium HGW-Riflebacteria-1]
MKAKVDVDTCIGCGLCEQICPDVFKMEEDKAVVRGETVPAEAETACQNAADQCPVAAITVE